jgi:hypothetical protein
VGRAQLTASAQRGVVAACRVLWCVMGGAVSGECWIRYGQDVSGLWRVETLRGDVCKMFAASGWLIKEYNNPWLTGPR